MMASNNDYASVTNRYFSGIDNKEWKLIAGSFTADAVTVYNAQTPAQFEVRGRALIVEQIASIAGRFETSCHTIANFHAVPAQGHVLMKTVATAHILFEGKVSVRGLLYEDQIVSEQGVWLVRHRIHKPLWQFEAASVPLRIPQPKS